MLNALKCDLKATLSKRGAKAVFDRLKGEVLSSQSELYNDVILTESRWNQALGASARGIIDFREKQLSFNNVEHALLWLIDRIEIADLASRYEQKLRNTTIVKQRAGHALACLSGRDSKSRRAA